MSLDCDDSCVEIYIKRDGKTIEGDFVCADFARQLERELAEADWTISHLRMENGLIEFYKCRDQIKELEGQLANMTAQRDALADALRELMFDCLRFRIEPSDDAYENAESALAALEGRGE
jgi:hypothetical protein